MKLVLICCTGGRLEELRRPIDAHEVRGYTEIPEAFGSGATGKHLGTRAWPGRSSPHLHGGEGRQGRRTGGGDGAFTATCSPEEGIRVPVLPVERCL